MCYVTYNGHAVKFWPRTGSRVHWEVVRRDQATVFESEDQARAALREYRVMPAGLVEVRPVAG